MQFQRCALFVAAALAALACAPAAAPGSSGAPSPAGQPKSGGVFTSSERASFSNFDPSTALRGEAT